MTQTEHHVVRRRASAIPASRERALQARSLRRQQREQQQQQRRPRGRRGPGGSLRGRRWPRGLGDGGEGGRWLGERAPWGRGSWCPARMLAIGRRPVLPPPAPGRPGATTRPQALGPEPVLWSLRPVPNLPGLAMGFWHFTLLVTLAKSSSALIKQMFLITEAERASLFFHPGLP